MTLKEFVKAFMEANGDTRDVDDVFVPDVTRIFKNYTDGHVFRNGVKVIAIKRKPMEVYPNGKKN